MLSEMTSDAGYCLEILLPASLEADFHRWVARTPGATWPSWGGHITLLSRFAPQDGFDIVKERVRRVCAAFAPFTIRLDQPVAEIHWRRPHLHTVFPASASPAEEGHRACMRLQSALAAALAPCRRDLRPEISGQPFLPHLTLTWGVPEGEAQQLVQTAKTSHLAAEFRVARVWLLEFRGAPNEEEEGGERISREWSFPLLGKGDGTCGG